MENSVYLEADIKIEEGTEALWEAASSVIELPKDKEKQVDLMYFSAIFVSSGENLNHAYFTPSELVKAEGTIINKALDVEHKEDEIIGHIYDRVFMDKEGNSLDLEELASMETASLDSKDIHIAIAGIIYKNRFPEIAKEVAEGKWKVSMEAYYQDYDIKIGDLLISKKEAEFLGIASNNSMLGKVAKVFKEKKEIAKGAVARVLRGLTFSGCGIVEKPANPPSVILETAKQTDKKEDSTELEIVLELDEDNNVTYSKVEGPKNKDNISVESKNTSTKENSEDKKSTEETEAGKLEYKDTVGLCVNYQRYVYKDESSRSEADLLHQDWCSKYSTGCTSFSRSATDEDCLIHKVEKAISVYLKSLEKKSSVEARRKSLLKTLEMTIANARSKDF